MKKRFLVLCCGIMLVLISLGGCNNEEVQELPTTDEVEQSAEELTNDVTELGTSEVSTSEVVELNIGVLQGPSAMGMVGLMDQVDNGNISDMTYHFTLAGSPDEVIPELVQGNFDIVAVPSNVASVLYNNTGGDIQVIAINTLGILHIVEAGDSITSVVDLRGRTIYASGNSATPEFVLNYILEGNGLDPQNDVNIEWLAEHTEVAARMAMSEDGVAMLPQPFVTVAQTENDDLRIALDLTEQWEHVQANADESPSALIMGVLVARRELIEQSPVAITDFLDHFAESVQFVNGNIEEAAVLIERYDLFPAPIATRALPYSNITFIAGNEMKELFAGYLRVLYEQNPESIGGALPDDDFYYIP